MNHICQSFCKTALAPSAAIQETAKLKGTKCTAAILVIAVISLGVPAWGLAPNVLPTGGTVTAGSGSIATAGNTLTVNQTSNKLAVNWTCFNIGSAATVNFQQPGSNAIALNRIIGSDASQIYGKLNANGQVFLLNPNGILFGKGAEVNVGGLVASTLSLSNADFLAGNYRFTGAAGSIVNLGSITTSDKGYVALLGGQVSNQGTISARLGTVALAAGSDIQLDFAGDGLLNVQVHQGAINALAENRQLINADGGTVLMTAKAADALIQSVVNNEGIIEARTIDTSGGVIKLLADMDNGITKVGGTLDASAPIGGNGGFIETSAAKVAIGENTQVTTQATNGQTGRWLIDPTDFTVAASGGDMTGAAVNTALASNNFEIQSSSGASGTAGNININDSVSWSSHTFTLNAANNININATLNGSNTAGLALMYGQGAVAAGNTSTYNVNAPVNLASTGSFSTKLGSDGATKNYTIVTTVPALQSITSGNYVLGSDIDLSIVSNFSPIGRDDNQFSGILDGLGHVISNLTINRPDQNQVGLFGYVGSSSIIRNVGLANANVTGGSYYVGSLVGANLGSIENVFATGSVTGKDVWYVGGLVGANTGTINNSYAAVNVLAYKTGGSDAGFAGGLVGWNGATGDIPGTDTGTGTIKNSYATGSVTADFYAGGLVGVNADNSTISNSYATGSVTAGRSTGGLVGQNGGLSVATITNSYAMGHVSADPGENAGGLVGEFFGGTITSSHFNSATTGQAAGCGGTDCADVTSLSLDLKKTASFSGWDISATGGSSAIWRIYEDATYPLLRSFLTPLSISVAGGSKTYDGTTNAASALTYSLDPVDTSKILGSVTTSSKNVGNYTVSASGLYSSQQGYDISNGGTGTVTINKASLTISTGNVTKTYDGTTSANGTAVATGGTSVMAGDSLSGGSFAFTDKNAGTGNKTVTVSGVTVNDGNSGNNYNVSYANNTTSTINKADLAVTATAVTKTYDGTLTASANGTVGVLAGVGAGETVNSSGSQTFLDKNAGTGNKTVRASGVTIKDSGNTDVTGNYTITYTDNTTSTINKADLTISTGNITKTYDGTTSANGTAVATGGTSVMAGDSLSGGSFAFTDKNAGTGNKTVTVSGVTVNDGNSGNNYTVSYANNTTSTINKADLTVTGTTASNKVYDGSTTASLSGGSLSGVIAGDTVNITGLSGTFDTKNVGTGKTVTVSGGSLSGANADNYQISVIAGSTTADITKKDLGVATVTASNKTYDGTTTASISGGSLTGVVSGDTVDLAQNGAFDNRNAGTGKTVTYSNTLSGVDAGNYSIAAGGTTTANIDKKDAIVTANSATVPYNGQIQSISGFSVTGLVAGETAAVLTNVTAGGSGKDIGTYATIASGSDINYSLILVPGTLKITTNGSGGLALVETLKITGNGSDALQSLEMLKLASSSGNTVQQQFNSNIYTQSALQQGNTVLQIEGSGIRLPADVNPLPRED